MVDNPIDALRACYETVGNLTEALIDALEFNHLDRKSTRLNSSH